MKLDVFSLIVLLGALQALFFSAYLFFTATHNKVQNRALAFFIFILSYNGFETLNWSSELFRQFSFFELASFILIFGLGPCIYIYVRSFRTGGTFGKKRPHFIPLLISLFCRVWILTTLIAQVRGYQVMWDAGLLNDWFGAIAEPLSAIVFGTYVLVAIREYRSLKLSAPDDMEKEAQQHVMRWLKTLLIVLSVFALIWIVTVCSPLLNNLGDRKYYLIEISLVIFIYWIGYAGYHRSRFIYIHQQQRNQGATPQLSTIEISRIVQELDHAMAEEKLYLDPELNLEKLATHLNVKPKALSAVLNQVVSKGFSEYLNGWRIEAVKAMIVDPSKRHLTISGIAYDCGFNSQPTFQRAFKTFTGQTPSQFIQNNTQIRI